MLRSAREEIVAEDIDRATADKIFATDREVAAIEEKREASEPLYV